MKKYYLLFGLLICGALLKAQTNTFPSSGNVGIGTTSPGAKLSFAAVTESDLPDGITWYSPDALSWGIYKTAGSWIGPNYTQLKLIWGTGIILDPGQTHPKSYVDIQGSGLRVTSGSIGIGTTDPQGYKLAVNGNIRAKEVKVENANWPDYVFSKEYELPSLQSTEQHIKEKGHLLGIPSAAEVKENGIDLGEINAKLLQKIEEITLYLIKQSKDLEQQNKDLQKQTQDMEKQNQQLAKQSEEMLKQSQEIKLLKETVSTLQKTKKP